MGELSKVQIELLTAGRELDALVAVEVMGWHEFDFRGQRCFQWPGYALEGVTNRGGGKFDGLWTPTQRSQLPAVLFASTTWPSLPAFSTDIAAAWPILEKLTRQHPQLKTILDVQGNLVWECRLLRMAHSDSESAMVEATAESAELAICKAALLATLTR